MRSFSLNSAVAFVVGFVALTAAAPAAQMTTELECYGTTVTALSTITVHDAPTTTVYLTASSSAGQDEDLSTTTLSHIYTSTRTTTVYLSAVSSAGGQESNLPTTTVTHFYTSTHTTIVQPYKTYEATVTQTLVVTTVYQTVNSMPPPSPSATGPLSFVIASGTTSWLGGVTPPSSVSYIVLTSSVVVVPVITPVTLDSTHTRTTTLHSTVYGTQKTRIIKTLSAHLSSAPLIIPSATAGISFSRTAAGGWNASSLNATYGFGSGFTKLSTSQSVVFLTEQPSYNLYGTRSSERLTASVAKSGFAANSVPTPSTTVNGIFWSGPGSAGTAYATPSSSSAFETTQSAIGIASSTALASASVYSVSAPSTQSAEGSSSLPPRDTTTTSCSKSESVTPLTTASGIFWSGSGSGSVGSAYTAPPSSSSFWTTQSAIGVPSSTTLAANSGLQSSTSCSSDFFTSSAIGAVTSSSSLSVATSSYAPAPLSSSSDLATSSAIGIVTSQSGSYVAIPTPVYHMAAGSMSTLQTSTSCTSSALATPTDCGKIGDFTFGFDDFRAETNATSFTATFLPFPYHSFQFYGAFVVTDPDPDYQQPYVPSSEPLLLEVEFGTDPNANAAAAMSKLNIAPPIKTETALTNNTVFIGNPDHGISGCFGYNFYGADFGCDSPGLDCVFTFSGYRFGLGVQEAYPFIAREVRISACSALEGCSLVPVEFTTEFQNVDLVRIDLSVDSEEKTFWMDDLKLGWVDNSCSAGLCRANTPHFGSW